MKHQPKALASQTLRSGAPLVAQRVTERFSAEESRQDVFDFLRAITENLSEGLYAIDAAGCLTFMNHAAERMLGWAETELRGNDMHATIHFQHADGTPFPRGECPLLQVIRAGSGRCRGDRLPVLREQARHSGGCLPGAKRDDCCGHPIAHDSGLTIATSATRDYRGDLSEFPREHALYDLPSG